MTDPTAQTDQASQQPQPAPQPVTAHHGGKEAEGRSLPASERIEETGQMELEPEVEAAGVVAHKEHIEVPPDLKSLGVSSAGSSIPAVTSQQVADLHLPLSSDQIEKGLHAKVIDSIRWLAEWCVKQIKRSSNKQIPTNK